MEVGLAPGQHGFFADRYGLFQARLIPRSSDSKRGWLRRFLKRNEPLIPKIAPERRSKSILEPLDRSIGFAEAGRDNAKWYGDTNSRSARSRSCCSIFRAAGRSPAA
jgi:hypothetical protein